MKKIAFCTVAILILLTLQVCSAIGFETKDNPIMIALSYLDWAKDVYGVTDLKNDFDYSLAKDTEITYVDDLALEDDTSKKCLRRVTLNYYNTGDDESQQLLRAMSLFSALEYGSPGDWNDANTLLAVSKASDFVDKLNEALTGKLDELKKGKTVPFYVSKRFTYAVKASAVDGITIIVA